MRALFLVLLCLPALAGCDAIVRHNGDYFEAGTDAGRFELMIRPVASSPIPRAPMTLRGMDGTGYDRNRAFNDVYGRCMTGRGYAPVPIPRTGCRKAESAGLAQARLAAPPQSLTP